MPRRADMMRLFPVLAAALTMAACAEPAIAPEHGKLWPHRQAIAEALTFRKGQLSATAGAAAFPCIQFWITGNPDLAEVPPEHCEDRARTVRAHLSQYVGVQASLDDARDPALWRFIIAETRL